MPCGTNEDKEWTGWFCSTNSFSNEEKIHDDSAFFVSYCKSNLLLKMKETRNHQK